MAATTTILEARSREKSRFFKPLKVTDYNRYQEPSEQFPDGIQTNDQYGFLNSTADECWLIGAVRCLGGETMVYDPVTEVSRRVDTIVSGFHVYAWDGQQLCITEAEKPFTKDIDDLYEVTLSTGESFVCSMSHLILTGDGFQPLSECPVGCAVFHPRSNSEPSTSVIANIVFKRKDVKWDFHVPVYNNYLAGGAIHHNSGKTDIEVYDIDLFCRGVHPVRSLHQSAPVATRMIAPKWRDNVKGNLIPKLKEMVRRDSLRGGKWETGYSEADHKLYYKNGSTIQFKSYEEDPETHDGVTLDAIYLDEPPPWWLYQKCIARLAERNGYLVGGMSTESGITWQRDHIDDPPEGLSLDSWVFSIYGNPYISAKGIKTLEAGLSRTPDLAAAKLSGLWMATGGLCVPQFDRNIHIIPDRQIELGAYKVFCIDTHSKEPCAMLWAAWETPSRLIIYRAEKGIKTIPEWQAYIRAVSMDDGKIHMWLGDEPNVPTKDNYGRLSVIAQFRQGENAIPLVQVPKGPGSVDAGIQRLRSMFAVDPITKASEIYIFSSCEHGVKHLGGRPHGSLGWELAQWSYRTEKSADEEITREVPRTRGIHYADDLRYIAAAGTGVTEPKKSVQAMPYNPYSANDGMVAQEESLRR